MEAPKYYQHSGYCRAGNSQFTTEMRHNDPKSGDHFFIDDLLDFSNEDAIINDGTFNSVTSNSTDSSTVTAVGSCNSSFSGGDLHYSGDIGCRNFADAQFSGDLCVPYDDLAELEWLSNFVEESFSTEDLQKLQLISGMKARIDDASETQEFQQENNINNNDINNNPIFRPEMSVPGKARSKRSRAAPISWSSRLLVLSPTTSSSESDVASSSGKKTTKGTQKKKEISDNAGMNGEGRKCLHCATDKTPQWRTGPMGPKTLCNACGVRYKSGRLVPEYRPAASPTFVLTKHSNSHRKVLELRRQKEMHQHQHQQQHQHHLQQQFLHPNTVFDVSSCDDYLIHHHPGSDFRQLI
ncbi:GATA transcription factor 12-like [Macadamia integrifolia]|uniref:GATA transcription factor 12-like n=1 Tax=Macadamia integrifolia TaxID=60698 RepID=UPI001C4F622D|nr:GATA transcription factor 12-like [Macadamia integrifolia]